MSKTLQKDTASKLLDSIGFKVPAEHMPALMRFPDIVAHITKLLRQVTLAYSHQTMLANLFLYDREEDVFVRADSRCNLCALQEPVTGSWTPKSVVEGTTDEHRAAFALLTKEPQQLRYLIDQGLLATRDTRDNDQAGNVIMIDDEAELAYFFNKQDAKIAHGLNILGINSSLLKGDGKGDGAALLTKMRSDLTELMRKAQSYEIEMDPSGDEEEEDEAPSKKKKKSSSSKKEKKKSKKEKKPAEPPREEKKRKAAVEAPPVEKKRKVEPSTTKKDEPEQPIWIPRKDVPVKNDATERVKELLPAVISAAETLKTMMDEHRRFLESPRVKELDTKIQWYITEYGSSDL